MRAGAFVDADSPTRFFVAAGFDRVAFFAGARFTGVFFADFLTVFRFVAISHLVVQYGVL